MTEKVKSEVISRRSFFPARARDCVGPGGDDSGLAAGDTGRRGVKR